MKSEKTLVMPQKLLDEELKINLQYAQLSILKEFDRVCKKLKITYCMAFGSSLGAKRHQGFIPWDDDIDVYMTISELEVLQNNVHLFKKNFFLQNHQSDPDYRLMITRLRKNDTTLIEKNEVNRDINHGIFIDIYPLFNTPQNGFGAKRLVIISMLYRLMLYDNVPQNRGIVMRIGSLVLLKTLPYVVRKKFVLKLLRILKKIEFTGYLSSLYGDEDKIIYPYDWFFPVQWVQFETIQVPVQAKHEKYLNLTYGDYMQLPPNEKQIFHHEYSFIDFNNSYTQYKGIYYCKK